MKAMPRQRIGVSKLLDLAIRVCHGLSPESQNS
jgi:hypothetical protein